MKIVLVGFEFESSNKGCEALSYAIMSLLDSIEEIKPLHIVNLNIHQSMGEFESLYPNISFTNIFIQTRSLNFWKLLGREIKDAVAVLDITHGDSFSDIYGKKWFARTTAVKSYIIKKRIPLILMPQTYGPYKAWWAKIWAKKVIKKSKKVFTRDAISFDYLQKLGIKKNIENTIDLAFMLPYTKIPSTTNKKKVGFNVSGLLWDDCKKSNNFELKVNYIDYCKKVLTLLSRDESIQVHLIPHVLCDTREGPDYFENDSKAIRELVNLFPNCVFPNYFETALDAKNYICNLDFLVAPRMHASIAAFSSNVPVLPFSYSRKFDGVFGDMNYDHVLYAKQIDTERAVDMTISSIRESDRLKEDELRGIELINERHKTFLNSLKSVLVDNK